MCGIAGILAPRGQRVTEDELERLTRELLHRGPDDQGWTARDNLGMAATRLAIVDPSDAGAQPMVDEGHVLAFNGEIYNHGELRRHLETEGIRFRGHSDTEVLFWLLRTLGVEAALPLLRGMFAFSWSDGERLWLARDRFGIKPVVWTRHGGRLIWASEARALRAVLTLTPDPTQALFAFLSLGDQSGRRTLFSGVEQVPPGHVLVADQGGHTQVTRWHSMVDEVDEAYFRELDGLPFRELSHRLDGLLTTAVGRMLMGDAPTATFVSGGVDSALLAALADDGAAKDHRLLAADVTGPRSEADAARTVARTLGREIELTRFGPRDLLEQWAPATLAYEAPLVTHMNALPYGALARRARASGVKSALTGEGADELFYGYAETAFAPFRSVLRTPVMALEALYGTVPGLAKRVLPELSDARESRLAGVSEDFEHARHTEEAIEAYGFTGRPARRHAAALDMMGGHLLSLLHRNDRMGMAASIESRFPYLDEEVVRFALNLPLSSKLRWGPRRHDRKHPFLRDKAVLREVAGRHLPPDIANRAKDGFPSVGHEQLEVPAAFFEGGWLAESLGWSRGGLEHLCTVEPRLVAARLASVEVFGRLYGRGDPVDEVTRHLSAHVTVHP